MKNIFTNHILNEVASYYGRMLLTEARKDMSKVVQSFQKQHPDMDVENFKEIIRRADPEFQVNDRDLPDGRHLHFEGVSEYGQWVGNRFVEGNITFNDVEDVRNALELYDTNKQVVSRNHPLTSIRTKEELFEIAKDLDPNYMPKKDLDAVFLQAMEDHGEENEITVLNDRDWLVKVPLNFETSRILTGDSINRSSGWCTGMHVNYFNDYRQTRNGKATNGEYYIIYSKRKPGKRWQFHQESGQLKAPGNQDVGFAEINKYGNARTLINLFKKLGKNLEYNSLWLKDMPTVDINEVPELLANGTDINTIFDKVTEIDNSSLIKVEIAGKINFLTNGRLLFNFWLSSAEDFFGGMCAIESENNRYNILTKDGSVVIGDTDTTEHWLDYVGPNQHGMYCIGLRVNGGAKYNFIKEDETLMEGGGLENWYDIAQPFKRGFAPVVKGGQCNMITTSGEYFSEHWFDWMSFKFENGLMAIGVKDGEYYKYNFITPEKQFIYNQPVNMWFDEIGYNENDMTRFHHGYIKVTMYVGDTPKVNLLNQNGELAWDRNPEEWFDQISMPFGRYAFVANDGKGLNILKLDGTQSLLVNGDWFEDCSPSNGQYFYVRFHGHPYIVDYDGIFYNPTTKEPLNINNYDNTQVNERMSRLINRVLNETIRQYLR